MPLDRASHPALPSLLSIGAIVLAMLAVWPQSPARGDTDAKTVRTFKAKCASCHGVDGKAQTAQGEKLKIPDMTTAAFQKANTDDAMKKAISEGFKREGMPEGMDPFKESLTPEQIDALVAYVRTLGK